MLVRPSVLQSGDARRGQPARIWAEQSREGVLEVAAGDAPEIQDRDQNFEALRATGVGRQDRGREPDAALTGPIAVANPWRMHGNRAKAGQDRAPGRCPWRTSRWRPSSVCLSAWPARKAATSASTACASRARAPARRTSVSGSENSVGWISLTTLSW